MPRRCLIVEHHPYETGGGNQQMQFVLAHASEFWGNANRRIRLNVFMVRRSRRPTFIKNVRISGQYNNSTRRISGFNELGSLPTCYLFFEETGLSNEYNVWWDFHKRIVDERYTTEDWVQGRDSGHVGRRPGRWSVIVAGPIRRQRV